MFGDLLDVFGQGKIEGGKGREHDPEGFGIGFHFLPDGEDPDSFVQGHGKQAFEALLASSPTLTEFLFQTLRESADTHTPEGQARLKEQARPLIERLPDGTLKTLAAQRLSELLGLSLDRIEGELGIRQAGGASTRTQNWGTAPTPVQPPRGVVSPARRAITTLVHYPALAAHADDVRDIALLDTPGAELLAELIKASFLLDVRDSNLGSSQMQAFGGVARALPFASLLKYPRSFQSLPSVVAFLLD